MINEEKLVTAILTQAVEDAKYTGTRKFYLKHQINKNKTEFSIRKRLMKCSIF